MIVSRGPCTAASLPHCFFARNAKCHVPIEMLSDNPHTFVLFLGLGDAYITYFVLLMIVFVRIGRNNCHNRSGGGLNRDRRSLPCWFRRCPNFRFRS